MQQLRVGKLNLIKCKSMETYLLLMWLFTPFVLTVARFVLVRVNVSGAVSTCIQWALTFVPFAFLFANCKYIPQRKFRFFLFAFALSALAFALTAMTNSQIGYFYTRESYGIARVFRPDSAIFAVLFFGLIDDTEDLYEAIKKYAYVDFAFLFIFDFIPAFLQGGWADVSPNGTIELYRYNLSFGYSMALPTILFIHAFLKEKKISHLMLGLAGLALILTNGSRGALLIPMAFVALMLVSNIIDSPSQTYKVFKIAVIFIAIIALLAFWKPIINVIVTALKSIGINSRTLDMLSSGKIASDNGRNEIWSAVVQAIKEGGIFGHGAYGDRPYVFPLHFAAYSHNIFLEMICSFGIIGVVICAVLLIGSARMIFCCKDTLTRELFLIFFSVSLQLLLSFSFWYVWEFWAAIAIANKYFRMNKKGALCYGK